MGIPLNRQLLPTQVIKKERIVNVLFFVRALDNPQNI